MSSQQSSALAHTPSPPPASRSSSIRDRPSLDIAARSILDGQAIEATVASVVAERAIDHCWEGLFEYAAIRVGPDAAARLLGELEQEVETATHAELEAEPGPRANLYHRLRARVRSARPLPLPPESPLFWRAEHDSYHARLMDLRRALTAPEAELLELRFARRLSLPEIAHVCGEDPARVQAALQAGVELTTRMLGRRPRSRDRSIEGALLEAFALDPQAARCPRRRARRPVLSAGQVIAARYKVEALLGAGAFADVYRAVDCDVSGHVVALKILRRSSTDASSVHTALRELQLIASVFHPSVVQLKDHGWHEGHLWFVTPLYRGETLARRLTRGALGRREAREIFEPLAEALATMHRAGVRHQDVKPENVFLANLDPDAHTEGDPGRRILPVLLDLGVAAKDAELVLAGTPTYFAPEVAARFSNVPDPPPVGPKADVFSLALTLRRALDPSETEHVAAGAVDAFVSFRASRAPDAPARRDLADLRPSFERWLHVSPDARPTAEELRRELSALTRPEERTARRLRLMRWALPTSLAVLATFAAVVYVLSREASLRKVEAEQARERAAQARQRAASIYASLTEQEARRRALEADVVRLEQEYQTSRMTRDELASRLAQAESELAVVAERDALQAARIEKLSDEEKTLREAQARASKEIENQSARVRELTSDLQRERARRNEAEARAAELHTTLNAAREGIDQASKRMMELEARIEALRKPEPSSPPEVTRAPQKPK
jgi:eukaryotic-like serine/threonine-protein kinase